MTRYWELVFSCGCSQCWLRQRRYKGEYIPHVKEMDYVCKLTGMNYMYKPKYKEKP